MVSSTKHNVSKTLSLLTPDMIWRTLTEGPRKKTKGLKQSSGTESAFLHLPSEALRKWDRMSSLMPLLLFIKTEPALSYLSLA